MNIRICIFLSTALAFTIPAMAKGASGYVDIEPKQEAYSFVGWPKGGQGPIHFKSSLYVKDGTTSVRIDEGKLFPTHSDSPVRTVADFDSVKLFKLTPLHSVPTVQGLVYVQDTVWFPVYTLGQRWIFPALVGPITLYSGAPGLASYLAMDTGTGIVPYSENALRRKISESPVSAKLLNQEKIGHRIAWGMALGGAGLLATGVGINLATESSGNPLAFAGLGLAVVSWIPHIMVQGKYEAAIRAYNTDVAAK